MQLLKVRKMGKHGDYLQQLERMMTVSKWEIMTVDEIFIHPSSEQSDATTLQIIKKLIIIIIIIIVVY